MKMWDGKWNAHDTWNTIEEIISNIRHRKGYKQVRLLYQKEGKDGYEITTSNVK
jgi:hypothetical protein